MEIRRLNFLRGFAAVIVVISHYSNTSGLLGKSLGEGAGQLGVMLFFLLSGFLMSYLYLHRKFDGRSVFKYLIARVARVAPLYYLIVIASYVLQKSYSSGILYDIDSLGSLMSHVFLLSGESVLWTIPVEIQFYFIFMLLWFIWDARRWELFVLVGAIIFAIFYMEVPRAKGSVLGLTIDTSIISSLPYFLVGLSFGLLFRIWNIPQWLQSGYYALTLTLVVLLYPNIYFSLTGNTHDMWQDMMVLYTLAIVFFSIVFLVNDEFWPFANGVSDFFGKISYSLYLLHMPILLQVEGYSKQYPALFLPVYLVLCILVSFLSFLFVEKPCREAIRSFSFSNQGKQRSRKNVMP